MQYLPHENVSFHEFCAPRTPQNTEKHDTLCNPCEPLLSHLARFSLAATRELRALAQRTLHFLCVGCTLDTKSVAKLNDFEGSVRKSTYFTSLFARRFLRGPRGRKHT